LKLAAIGPATADALASFHLRADIQPDVYRAEALAESLLAHGPLARVLLVRASRGRETLADMLSDAGCDVEQIVVYNSTDVDLPDPMVAGQLAAGQFDWVTVTSSAIARSLVRLFGDDLRRAKFASISPLTSLALRDAGFDVAAEAKSYTTFGLVDAICEAESVHP
jgi:uroporphyrinogen III methyltransferase/synthase